MKNLVILFLLTFSSYAVSAQYFEVGMKWTYLHAVGGPPAAYWKFNTIEIVGDTIVDGEKRFVLDGGCNCTPNQIKMISQENQKVYYYWNGEKRLLYDYSLVAGDTLMVKAPDTEGMPDSLFVYIESVTTKNIGGQDYQVQITDPDYFTGFGSDWGDNFIEGIGSYYWCLFPQEGLCEEGSFLRCVTYADGTTIKFTDEPDCYVLGTDDIELSGISIQPNPMDNRFFIENPDNHSFAIQIFNQQGQLMFAQKEIRSANQEVITKDWATGTYLVRLASEKGVFTRMIVKE